MEFKGAGGGPAEDDVTGLLVRSTKTQWSKGSILAVDAGTHLAAIARILEEQAEKDDDNDAQALSAHVSFSEGPGTIGISRAEGRPRNGVYHDTRPSEEKGGGGGARRFPPGLTGPSDPSSNSNNPFAGLRLPSRNPRANAAYITRELVSTYLITHPHLDHISGFVINTACFQRSNPPKRLAALSTSIDAIKKHVFNDLIWPNLSDEDGGIGLVSYMRLGECKKEVGIGDGAYEEICEGLEVQSWKVSHGTMTGRDTFVIPLHRRFTAEDVGLRDRLDVYDSTVYFLRDRASRKEVLIFGDVEPDTISSKPRTARVWMEAAPKIVAGRLTAVFIECSYDDSQSDNALFGHLAPRHLIAELRFLANRVCEIRRENAHVSPVKTARREGGGSKKRKREDVNVAVVNDERILKEEEETHDDLTDGRKQRVGYHHDSDDDDDDDDDQQQQHHKKRYTRWNHHHERQPPSSPPPSSSFLSTADVNHSSSKGSFEGHSSGHPVSKEISEVLISSSLANSSKLEKDEGNDIELDNEEDILIDDDNDVYNTRDDDEEVEDEDNCPLKGLKVVIIHVKDPFRHSGPDIRSSILEQLLAHDADVYDGHSSSSRRHGDDGDDVWTRRWGLSSYELRAFGQDDHGQGHERRYNEEEEGEEEGEGGEGEGDSSDVAGNGNSVDDGEGADSSESTKPSLRRRKKKKKGREKEEEEEEGGVRRRKGRLGCEFIISKRGQSILL